MAEQMGLSDTVVFSGNIPNDEIKHYLYASELFLFASKSETQGIVLEEAMAAGNPVVVVRASGVERKEEMRDEEYTNRKEHTGASILRLFKTS